jgi:SNF2 family DNA or RNA helicase
LVNQWVDEIKKISSKLAVDYFDHKTNQFIRRTGHRSSGEGSVKADVVLTTYQAVGSSSFLLLGSTHWARVVLDEMQEIRSNTTTISKNCNSLVADRRWMLSGTPLFEGQVFD